MNQDEEGNHKTSSGTRITRVVVATTVALTFISFWRASAVVVSDLGSSMFYVGGIAAEAFGRSAPWFILGVMVFAYAIRSVYIESCSMFVRGGVYVVVRDSMGPVIAKFSVSALIFDYLITGPISAVSAGQYIAGLINETYDTVHGLAADYRLVDPNMISVLFALGVTVYFWRANILGIHESSGKALRIAQVTVAMIALLVIWSLITISFQGSLQFPPAPIPANLHFKPEALGWFQGTFVPSISAAAIIIAFGHSILAVSGEETLAQVYREIAYPKLHNLKITGLLIFLFSLIGTGFITLFAFMIIPASAPVEEYKDNLLGALVMYLSGPPMLKLLMHGFVVFVGFLILSGAVNTSLIGANAVMNRVAEDGVLLHWFRRPHPKYGTTFRIINILTVLQLLTILFSRGDVYLLGEAYAFGVIWSFCLKSLGVLVLRYQRKDQGYKVPLNFQVGKIEIPLGLIIITLVLFMVAVANLFTKEIATIYGGLFTLAFFTVFTISEKVNRRQHAAGEHHLEQFNIVQQPEVTLDSLGARPGSTLVAVRESVSLHHLQWVLDTTKGRHRQIVVSTIRPLSVREGEYELSADQYFSHREQELFTHVVEMAEKAGKHVDLLVVPSASPYDGLVHAAEKLRCSLLVVGSSPRLSNDELARRIGLAWERVPEPRHPFSLAIIGKRQEPAYVTLGPHAPRLWPEDVDLVHHLWLKLSDPKEVGAKLHHRDVIGYAVRRLKRDLESRDRDEIIKALERDLSK